MFLVDWSKSGGSTAKVCINHEKLKQVECHIKKVKSVFIYFYLFIKKFLEGFYVCSFYPLISGLYLLDIFIDDMRLPGTIF